MLSIGYGPSIDVPTDEKNESKADKDIAGEVNEISGGGTEINSKHLTYI